MIILKNRGERMRKLIILLVLTAFIVTLSSPILYAAQWDSANGPNWVDQRYVERADLSGDDSGWADVDEVSPNNYNDRVFSFFNYRISKFFIILVMPFIINEEADLEENETNCNQNFRGN